MAVTAYSRHGKYRSIGSMTGEKAAQALHSYMGYAALEDGAQHVPSFTGVEIGGGRITGTEISEELSMAF